jgi:AraC family chemosensory pili system transcriptional regulator ChpD
VFDVHNKFRRFSRFEVAEFNCPEHIFPKHSHDEFVLGTNLMGRESVTLDRRSFDATTDQLTLYNPAQVQSSHAISAEWSFVSIYLRPSDFAGLTGLEENITFGEPVKTSPSLSKSVACFVRHAMGPLADEDLLELELGNLLIDLLQVSGSRYADKDGPSDLQMHGVAELLLDHMAAPPRVSDIAQDLGVSPVALVRAFKRAYGLPPLEWLNLQRINVARVQLRRGRPLVDVAFDLGYADQPHFNRRFKAATGLTPSVFSQVK